MHRFSKRITLTAAVVGVVAIGGGVTGALAATGQLSSSSPQPVGVATAVTPGLSAHYELFRRPAAPADALPPAPSGRADYGQNTELARRVGDSGYYAVPGTDDSLCLLTPVGGGVCGRSPMEPTIVTSGTCRGETPDTFRVVGVFPDGVTSVDIASTDRSVDRTLTVDTNGVSADLPVDTGPLTISWSTPDGKHSSPLPIPPGAGHMYCGPDSRSGR